MPHPRIEPWISREDYDAFLLLAPDDPALGKSYDEWLEQITELMAVFVKSGVPIERVHIRPDEFQKYCIAHSINPDGVARASFAVSRIRKK